MKYLTLENIASICRGRYVGEEALKKREIAGVVTDSRQVEKDFLFVPLKGERVDGHDLIPSVFERGALATLSEHPVEQCSGPCILVDSCFMALKEIASYYRSHLTIPVVGITGSVGKTSTKEMISSVLSTRYKVLKTAGNFNNEIGLPLTILRIREEHEAAVVEMGISEFGEMHRLAAIARPDICVITNIGTCHLENLGDRDGVLKAKTEVFDHIRPGVAVFLNGDDDKLRTVTDAGGNRPVFYGLDRGKRAETETESGAFRSGSSLPADADRKGRPEPAIYMDETENLGLKGTRARLHTPVGDIVTEIPIPGSHNLYNAMAAAGVGLTLGLTLTQIREGIANARAISGRTNLVEAGGILIIDDCYNANPMSMRAALDVLKTALGRTVAVLGDMSELGEREKELHYEVGAYAASVGIDVLICVGSRSEETERGAREMLARRAQGRPKGKPSEIDSAEKGKVPEPSAEECMQIFRYTTRDELLPELSKLVKAGDTVLVKASHFMDFPKVVEALKSSFIYH